MSIVVKASRADVEAALQEAIEEPQGQAILARIRMTESTTGRRSLGELPTITTVIEFVATSVAMNITYDIAKKLVLDAVRKRFGTHAVSESPDEEKRKD